MTGVQTCALPISSQRLGDKKGEVHDLIHLGNAKWELGDIHEAIHHFEAALVKARQIGERRAEADALGSLGNAHYRLRRVFESMTSAAV